MYKSHCEVIEGHALSVGDNHDYASEIIFEVDCRVAFVEKLRAGNYLSHRKFHNPEDIIGADEECK